MRVFGVRQFISACKISLTSEIQLFTIYAWLYHGMKKDSVSNAPVVVSAVLVNPAMFGSLNPKWVKLLSIFRFPSRNLKTATPVKSTGSTPCSKENVTINMTVSF